MDKCTNSGRPLRAKFDGLFFLLGDTFRVIDLEGMQDRLLTERDIERSLGLPKWNRIKPDLELHGFYEKGNYRIEAWEDAS